MSDPLAETRAAIADLTATIERLKSHRHELLLAATQALVCIRVALPDATDTIAALERAIRGEGV